MREIKLEYLVIKPNGFVLRETFPIGDIERGYVTSWLKSNNIGAASEIHKRQFTGQSVKKGVELFEGDVLSFDWLYQGNDKPYSDDSIGIVGVIEWRDKFVVSFLGGAMSFDLHEINQATFERFWCQCYHSSMTDYFKMVNFRLIGNIHQNPELMDQKP